MSYTKEQFPTETMTMAEIEEFAKKLKSGELGWTEPNHKTTLPDIPIIEHLERMEEKPAQLTESGIDPTDLNAVKKTRIPVNPKATKGD